MTDSSGNAPRPSIDELREAVEIRKLQATLTYLDQVDHFLDVDLRSTEKMLELLDLVVQLLRERPEDLSSSTKDQLERMIATVQREREAPGGGTAGSDIVGGAPEWVEIIRDIVDIFSGVVKEEKAFFMSLIKLIFCDC